MAFECQLAIPNQFSQRYGSATRQGSQICQPNSILGYAATYLEENVGEHYVLHVVLEQYGLLPTIT